VKIRRFLIGAGIEVEQQSDLDWRCAKVVEHLRLEGGVGSAHGLDLDEYGRLDDQIRVERCDPASAEMNGDRHFTAHAQTGLNQHALHCGSVYRLRKAESQLVLHLMECRDHAPSDPFVQRRGPIRRARRLRCHSVPPGAFRWQE